MIIFEWNEETKLAKFAIDDDEINVRLESFEDGEMIRSFLCQVFYVGMEEGFVNALNQTNHV